MIDVIIPTRDRWPDLRRCLDALAAQQQLGCLSTVIVVDDHSKAPPGDQVAEFAHKTRLPLIYLENIAGRGAAPARNLGAARAKGRLLAFLDDDAVPEPDWLAVLAQRFGRTDVSAVTGRILPLDPGRLASRARQLRYELRQHAALRTGGYVDFLAAGNCAILRSVFEALDGFDSAFEWMHDRELAVRMRSREYFCAYEHRLVVRHRHYKGIYQLVRASFQSSRYRVRLEELYPEQGRLLPATQIRSFWNLSRHGLHDRSQLLPALTSACLETLHYAGYLWYSRVRSSAVAPPITPSEKQLQPDKHSPRAFPALRGGDRAE